jgi:hypothetical protein
VAPRSYPVEFPSYVHAISLRACIRAKTITACMNDASLIYVNVHATHGFAGRHGWKYTLRIVRALAHEYNVSQIIANSNKSSTRKWNLSCFVVIHTEFYLV